MMLSDNERFSRKVFVGGLPIDITELEVKRAFEQFGTVLVDWPRRSELGIKDRFGKPVTGYAFLIYQEEIAVQRLVSKCYCEGDKYYMLISSQTMHNKPVQIRPWSLGDVDYMPRPSAPLNPRHTVFIGGVPRPTKASELAFVLESMFGPVCYAGVDIDPELKYPKGAARVTFNTYKSYVAAMQGRFVNIPHTESSKRVEIKPYVVDDQMCDNCQGKSCSDRYAPYFCGDVSCLQYYCEKCWDMIHYGPNRLHHYESHKPFIRLGDQTRLLSLLPHHQQGRGRPITK